jgi:uncharacterized coiled-coil DUF342 family protein
MQAIPRPSPHALLLLAACLSLTSCEETQKLQREADETNAKVQAIQQETQQMDMKMAQNRREIPAYVGAGEAAIKQYTVQLAAELAAAEGQVARAQAEVKDAETALAQARKSLAEIKSKDPR